jgi:hypothetical protein
MHIVAIMFTTAVGGSWRSVGGQLLASGVLLLCGHQDMGSRTRIGATFWFFMALAFGTSALSTALWARFWGGVVICAVALCFEAWLIRRLWAGRPR